MLNEPHAPLLRLIKVAGYPAKVSVEQAAKVRCLFSGAPAHIPSILLSGLRKELRCSFVVGFGSAVKTDMTPNLLSQMGFMEAADASENGKVWKKRRFTTTLKGLELLRKWAENKNFKPYLDAYLPKDWERKQVGKAVLKQLTEENSVPQWTTEQVISRINALKAQAQAPGGMYQGAGVSNTLGTLGAACQPAWVSRP